MRASVIIASLLSFCFSGGLVHAQWYVAKCQHQWGTSKVPELNPGYLGVSSPTSGFSSGEVQFPSYNSPPSHVLNNVPPVAARICAYDQAQALSVSMHLTDGRFGSLGVQEGNCTDVAVATVDVGSFCWWRPRFPHNPCHAYSVHQYCIDGYNDYVDKYTSYGWVLYSATPGFDFNLHQPVTFNFRGASNSYRPFYILSSEITRQVQVCTPMGVTIFYDQSDPYGQKNPMSLKTTVQCPIIEAKSIWFSGHSLFHGTYRVYY
jgi:hypothetical protein